MVWPLLALGAVVLITAELTGGIGLRSAGGSANGGKRYVFVLAAIVAYFALTAQRIPLKQVKILLVGYFASALVPMVSNLIYLAGPAFYFLYWIFPVDMVYQQAAGEYSFARRDYDGQALPSGGRPWFMYCSWFTESKTPFR